jgi:predicted SAM-dependent methyltransferase
MFHYKSCPVCGSERFSKKLTCKDHTVSGEFFFISGCADCTFLFTNPIPEVSKLGDYYKSEDYISHSNTTRGLVSRLYKLVRNRAIRQKLALVESFVSRGTLLDYGCGTGSFLTYAGGKRWKAVGLEPSETARKVARESGSLVYTSRHEAQLESGSVDAITLWHVLEHVPDLHDTLNWFYKILKETGVLVIAVPNHKSFDAEFYQESWAAYDVPRHLYHFSKTSISLLLRNHKFKLEAVKPMTYDAYYVSLLSEKYKNGKTNYVRSFRIGLESNHKARATGDYSSLIYIFKKI